jgi:hypothetical protein
MRARTKWLWRLFFAVVLLAGLVFVWLTLRESSFHIFVDGVAEEFPGFKIATLRLVNDSDMAYWICVTNEVRNGENWQISQELATDPPLRLLMNDSSVSLRIRVPSDVSRWRVRLDSEKVRPDEVGSAILRDDPLIVRYLQHWGLIDMGPQKNVRYVEIRK